jgi:hypothetical protein
MQKINLNLALNAVSFGAVGYGITHELIKRGQPFDIAPISQLDFSSFSKMPEEEKNLLTSKANNFTSTYSRKNPALRLWHIRGSETSIGNGNHLMTFHELDELTPNEVNVLNNQEQVFVTNEETRQVFLNYGVTVPVHNIPLGYDTTHFYPTNKSYLGDDTTVWVICGKLEARKWHHKVIPLWLKKYGNNPKHRLHLHVHNVHLKKEENEGVLAKFMGGKKYFNVSVYPYLENLTQLNEAFNCANIILDGGANEGWSLPAFHCLGLGKYMVGVRTMGVREWAGVGGADLIDPDGKVPCYDGKFFQQGTGWNQGNFYSYDTEKFSEAMDSALTKKLANKTNQQGFKIQEEFTWGKTVDQILTHMGVSVPKIG